MDLKGCPSLLQACIHNLSAGHHKSLLCKLTNTSPRINENIFITVKAFIWLSYHLSSCQCRDLAERLPTRGEIRAAGLVFVLYTLFSFSYTKQWLNQVQHQYDTRKCCYHFRAQCQVSRKQLFFKKWLCLENCLRKYSGFFPKDLLRNYLTPCLPPNSTLKSLNNAAFPQSQYAIHRHKKVRWLCIMMPSSNACFKNIFQAETQLLKKRQFNHISQTEYTICFLHTVFYFKLYFEVSKLI